MEAVKEVFDKTPLLLVHLDFSALFRDSLVLISNGVLQEYDLLADFGFLLFRKMLLPFDFLLQLFDALFRLVKFGVPKERVERTFYSELARLLFQLSDLLN